MDEAAASGPTWTTPYAPMTLTENTPMADITLSATGMPPITYSDDGMLPSGLILEFGVISGTPDDPNIMGQTVVLTATDMNGSTTTSLTFPSVDEASGGNVAWGASLTGMPTTLVKDTPMTSFSLSDSVSDEPATAIYSVVGIKPSWLTLFMGTVSGTPDDTAGISNVTFKVVESGNISNSATTTVSFPAVTAGGETITFTTAEALGTKEGGEEIGPINIQATASLGSTITYQLNTSAGFINLSGGQISGIAPRLLSGMSYTVTGTATIAGSITNSRTFTILIAEYTPCMSPVANVCS